MRFKLLDFVAANSIASQAASATIECLRITAAKIRIDNLLLMIDKVSLSLQYGGQ